MRAALVLVASGCGRLGFDAAIDAPPAVLPGDVVRYPMDNDPTTGEIASEQLPASCTTCPTPTIGRYGGGYQFDGTVAFELPSTTLVGAAPYSIAVWFTLASYDPTGAGRSIVDKPFNTVASVDVLNIVVFNQMLAMETTQGGPGDYTGAGTIDLGVWHHLVASWDGATKRIYLDGALVNMTTVATADSQQRIRVGGDLDGGTAVNFWDGTLDELQFYPRTLSDADVALLHAQ